MHLNNLLTNVKENFVFSGMNTLGSNDILERSVVRSRDIPAWIPLNIAILTQIISLIADLFQENELERSNLDTAQIEKHKQEEELILLRSLIATIKTDRIDANTLSTLQSNATESLSKKMVN